jgi:hypothetical protein
MRRAASGERRAAHPQPAGCGFPFPATPPRAAAGFRRSRNYGLLHHLRKIVLRRVQLMLRVVIPPVAPVARRPLLCRQCEQPIGIRAAARQRPRVESGEIASAALDRGAV